MNVNSETLRLLLKGTDSDLGANTVASVVITGICVVFIGLIILIVCVSLYGAVFNSMAKKKAEKAKAEAEAKLLEAEDAPRILPPPDFGPDPDIEDGIEEEIVAVIAAAIAAMGAASGKRLALRSIKTAKGARSAWANAGIADNTRPF